MTYTVKVTPAGQSREFWVTKHGGLGDTKVRAVRFEDKDKAEAFAQLLRNKNGDRLEVRVTVVRD